MHEDEAAGVLYRCALSEFVSERKRLAGELKAAGDKAGAQRVGKLTRPPVSAWVVNQLWWGDEALFQELFAAAGELKAGEFSAKAKHKSALGELRVRAARLLTEAGHGASEILLRRVTTNLSALAARGSFAPDDAGRLTSDRDPPGFESLVDADALATTPEQAQLEHADAEAERVEAARVEAARAEAERVEAERLERKRLSAERAQRREELAAQLAALKAGREILEEQIKVTRAELDRAQRRLVDTGGEIDAVEARIATLDAEAPR